MKHYRAPDNTLHALSEADIERGGETLLPQGCLAISDEEAQQIRQANLPAVDPQVEINATARAYLASTDWYVLRKQETGEAIPTDVREKRQKARDSVK